MDVNGNTTTLPIDDFTLANGTFFSFDQGWSEMVFKDTINDCVDTVKIGVYCSGIDTTYLSVDYLDSIEYCFDDLDLLGKVISINDILFNDPNNIIVSSNDSCLIIVGNNDGSDTLFYEVCDDLDICDTNYIIINVTNFPEGIDSLIYDTLYIGQTDIFCFDTQFLVY